MGVGIKIVYLYPLFHKKTAPLKMVQFFYFIGLNPSQYSD